MIHKIKEQQSRFDFLKEELHKVMDKMADLLELHLSNKEDKYYNQYSILSKNRYRPMRSELISEECKLRKMIYESDIESLKTQRIHLDNLFDLKMDYERKHSSFRKEENRYKYEQEILNPHYELMEKEEEKLRQMIFNL